MIDAGRGNSRRINATTRNRRIIRLFLGTAIVGDRIPRQISEAYQGRGRGHGKKNQSQCNPDFSLAEHIRF